MKEKCLLTKNYPEKSVLYSRNANLSKKKNASTFVIYLNSKRFGGNEVRAVLETLCAIRCYKNIKYIEFKCNSFRPVDKLSYVIFEAIICELIEKYHYSVFLNFSSITRTINTDGIQFSIIDEYKGCLLQNEYVLSYYKKNYKSKKHKYSRSFRRIVDHNKAVSIAELGTDIKMFLSMFDFGKDDAKKISEIVSELADNACEHGRTDCLVDIDVSDDHNKIEEIEKDYYAVNICVLNFSDTILGDELSKKINSVEKCENKRYLDMMKAYKIHKAFFNEKYTEEHFFALASFQNEISGRPNEYESGGKGLAELLKEVEKNTTEFNCYVLFGNKILFFNTELLDIDDNEYISFNKERDFINSIPDESVITDSLTYLNGTGYNLTLIYKKEGK